MNVNVPYLLKVGNITKILDKIQKLAPPRLLTSNF